MAVRADVAIVGAGPAGSTAATILRTHAPDLSVLVVDRATFPREHVGESQLPPIGGVLEEMGVWDRVEAAGFPVKLGATYRWGRTRDLWDFDFLPPAKVGELPRPGTYDETRRRLAFQVDRFVYDKILLDRARELGAEVREGVGVRAVERDGDRIERLALDDGTAVEAKHYIDASGGAGVLRRALGVECDVPTKLKNIAVWNYWRKEEWRTTLGKWSTRVLVLSLGWGWIWFIPLGPARVSIGLVCPAATYRESAMDFEALYAKALDEEPLVKELLRGAEHEGKLEATKDWSFVADRTVGGNWFLAGEAAGFADPILAAGLTLTHMGAREAAYTIIALERGTHKPQWLRKWYDRNQRTRVRQHIRFADFWYSANGVFTDLQEHTREIAKEAGLDLEPAEAFRWLGTGGFSDDILGQVGVGGFDLTSARHVAQEFLGADAQWELSKHNMLWVDRSKAEEQKIPAYAAGKVEAVPCLVRGGKRLPLAGLYATTVAAIDQHHEIAKIVQALHGHFRGRNSARETDTLVKHCIQIMEVMLSDGWLKAKRDPSKPCFTIHTPHENDYIHSNRELEPMVLGAKPPA